MPDEPSGALAVLVATISGCLFLSALALLIGRWIAR